MIRRLRLFFSQAVRDLQPGDMVRRIGYPGVGFVESIKSEHAVVAWNKDRRDILPLFCLRRVPSGGHSFDCRKGAE